MLVIVTWYWGDKYGAKDVLKLFNGCKRHLRQPFEFRVITDCSLSDEQEMRRRAVSTASVGFGVNREIWDHHLTKIPGCFARLRMFDPEWQATIPLNFGDRLVCMDLDSVVTGNLDPLFNRPETFMILRGANASNPCPVNGSLMMLRAGYHAEVWSEFSLEKAKAVPFFEFPDDQAWLHHMLPKAIGWNAGPQSGVYAFKKTTWPAGDDLPSDARLVVFPGWRSPNKFKHLPWVREHWA